MLLSPNEDLAFTNSFSIPRGPPTYKSYRKDADLQRHTSFSVALQRLIFPDSNSEYGISSINDAEALRSPPARDHTFAKNNTRPLRTRNDEHANYDKRTHMTGNPRLEVVKYSRSDAACCCCSVCFPAL